MPLSDRDYVRGKHPPNCSCVDCVNKRLGITTQSIRNQSNNSINNVEPNNTTTKYRKSKLPYSIYALLVIIIFFIVGVVISLLVDTQIPLWLLLGFSVIFSLEKWFHHTLGKNKALGKLYRLILNLLFLSLLGLLIWTGIKVFSQNYFQSALIGSLLFICELCIFIWFWRVLSRNIWRWPSLKLTTFSLVIVFLILSFAGVNPFSTYKDTALSNVSNWWEYINNARNNTQVPETSAIETEKALSETTGLISHVTESIKEFVSPPTDINDYITRFNEYRQVQGCAPLSFTDDLNKIAALRLKEIQITFSHDSKGNYNNHLAENIVMGIHSNQAALDCWQGSPGHNANMLDKGYRYTGYAIGGGYAVQVFTEYQTINGEPQLPPGWYWTN
jgi:uncharacterized protein YkwD